MPTASLLASFSRRLHITAVLDHFVGLTGRLFSAVGPKCQLGWRPARWLIQYSGTPKANGTTPIKASARA